MARRILTRDSGKSILFARASNNNIDLGATDFIGTGDISICGWIRPVTVGETAGRIFDNGATVVQLEAANRIRISRNNSTFAASSNNSIVYGAWQSFVVTATSGGICNLYLNGVLSGTTNQSGGAPIAATTNGIIGSNAALSRDFEGNIFDLRFYNRILTSSEASDFHFNGSLPYSPIANYQFRDNANDLSGNGRNGTVTGATYSTNTPIKVRSFASSRTLATNRILTRDMGTALRINTFTDFIDVPDAGLPASTFQNGFTVGAWIKLYGWGGSSVGAIMTKDESVTGTNGFLFGVDHQTSANDYVRMRINGGTTRTSAASTIQLNVPKHIIASVASDGTVTFYINGVQSGNAGISAPCSQITTTNALRIGNRSTATDRQLQGIIDEPFVINRPITATEAKNIAQLGATPPNAKMYLLFNETTGTTALDSSGNGNNGTITGATYTTDTPKKLRNSV
jgi:Concanavalin A-like lectin/glucanases superfamily